MEDLDLDRDVNHACQIAHGPHPLVDEPVGLYLVDTGLC